MSVLSKQLEMEFSSLIFSYIVLFTTFDLGQHTESITKGISSVSKPRPAAKDGFTATWKFSSNYLVNPFDRPRIPRQLPRDSGEVPSLPDRPEEQWLCKAGAVYCVFISSRRNNWLDASESCSALGGMLPFWTRPIEDAQLFTELNNATSWSSLYWDTGRWHLFDQNKYSPVYVSNLGVNDVVLRHIAKGEHCFAIGNWVWLSPNIVPIRTPGYKCNITLPFMCITAHAKFNETLRKLSKMLKQLPHNTKLSLILQGLPLKEVIDIEFKKIAGLNPGTEVLRCVAKFQYAYEYLKDRPFKIVWILDGAYYPEEGIRHGDHSTTITVPYKNFTKYACEVRYLGSFYGNRSQVIEVATPSRDKLGLFIRIRNATFSPSSLDYYLPIRKLEKAISEDPGAFNVSDVGHSMFVQNGSELSITAYMLSDSFPKRELTDMHNYEKQIETLNALLNDSYINQQLHFQKNTLEAINFFVNHIKNGTLVDVYFFAVDRCPLERSASYFWAGGVGQRVQPSLTGDTPADICLDEYKNPVNRTCSGSLVSAAQWVEPFSEIQNCSRASNKSTGTFCHAENSLHGKRSRGTSKEVEERPLRNLSWIETSLDRTTFSREGCVFEGGSLVQRTCIGDIYHGAYWGPTQAWNAEGQLVNLSNKFICARPSETTSRLLSITESQQNATSVLAELQQVASQWDPIIADVQLSALIFSNASREETEFSQTNVEQTASIIQQVLNVDTETLANAQRLPNVSTNLLMGIEEILTNTNSSKSTLMASALGGITAELTGSSPFLFTANSSNLGELNDTVANTGIVHSTSTAVTDNHQHDALVILNVSSLMVNRINASQIAFVYHPNIRLADAAVAVGKTHAKVYSPNPGDGDRDLLRTAKHIGNSAMVQVAVKGGPVYNLSELVNIYFRPFRAVNTSNSSNSVVCAFWNPEVSNGRGGWSTHGCSYQGMVSGLDHCQCNHLSGFTAFFAYDDYEPTSHDSTLDSLTKIGCGFSLLGCIGVIATYAFFPKWRKPKPGYYGHHVIFHLSLALAMLLSTFLVGFDQTSDDHVCLLVAVFLHYLILVVFFWMLVEAYHHYSLFLRVWGSMTSYFMLKAFLFAWVLPLVPVIALVVCNRELYYYKDGNKYCWLKPQGFYYALLPFASVIGLINLALYILIIVKVGCAKSTVRSTQSKHSFTFHTAIIIFFIMGLSWIFGLLAIGRARTFFSYLFCILNSLQGFAIFLHFIFRGARAQEDWKNFIEGKSDREKARDRILNQAKLRKPPATHTCCATSETALSTSTGTVHSRIIGELKNRQRQQNYSQYETSKL